MAQQPDDSLTPRQAVAQETPASEPRRIPSRRAFLKGFGVATIASTVPAMALAAGKAMPDVISDLHSSNLNINARRHQAYQKRLKAAAEDRKPKTPPHPNNGDEALYPSGIANSTKGFKHDNSGGVGPAAYAASLAAIRSGKRADFDALVTGGVPLVDPQAGLAFDLETCDPSQNSMPPFATLNSPNFAAQMIESYWEALLRDVPFSQWGSDPNIALATAELTGLPAFAGPRIGGAVTPQTLFRGFTPGDVIGPYVSQFFIQPFTYGAMPFTGYLTTQPGDFVTDEATWLKVQNGLGAQAPENPDPNLRYLGTPRDL